ncbi:MAG: MafI family immunity protein [Gammaproteobacteria bacterium]|nr:MafI family immunity protein [Gammaproteobacteria bacterium]
MIDNEEYALMEKYRSKVLSITEKFKDRLGADLFEEVRHLLEHNENGEALRTLAWIISDEGINASRDEIANIVELCEDLVIPEDLPKMFRMLREFQVIVWEDGKDNPGTRDIIEAISLEDAVKILRSRYGDDITYTMHNAEDADKPR